MAIYTKAQFLTAVRSQLQEPVADFWDDAYLNAAIDWAARMTSGITRCVRCTEVITGATDVMAYALTKKYLKIDSVVFNDITGMKRLSPSIWGRGMAGGVATDTVRAVISWWHWEDYLYLWPTPKGTANIGTKYDVYGWRTAYSYEYSTAPAIYDIPDAAQTILMDFVLAIAYLKAGKHLLVDYHMNKYIDKAETYRDDVIERMKRIDARDKTQQPNVSVQGR